MEWVLILAILAFVIHRYAKRKAGRGRGVKSVQLIEIEESPGILVYTASSNTSERNVVEFINKDGVPEFKFRFYANLEFETASDVLRRHRAEIFFPRPNGYRGPVVEPGGVGAQFLSGMIQNEPGAMKMSSLSTSVASRYILLCY